MNKKSLLKSIKNRELKTENNFSTYIILLSSLVTDIEQFINKKK